MQFLGMTASDAIRGGGTGTSTPPVASVLNDKECQAMDDPLPPYSGDDGDVVADENICHTTCSDDEHCAMDSPLPPHDFHRNDDGDAGKTTRSRITSARVCLAIGLGLEVSATLWAFWQAFSAGALTGENADCDHDSSLFLLHASVLVQEKCDGSIDADIFFNATATLDDDEVGVSSEYSISAWEDYVSCDTLAPESDSRKFCTCDEEYASEYFSYESCSWVLISSPSDDICYAHGVATNSSDGTITANSLAFEYFFYCWPSNPSGSMELTITALASALSSQCLEAYVGFKYWKCTEKRAAAFTLATSVFEALGVVAVSSVLLTLRGFFVGDLLYIFMWLAWATVLFVVVGVLAEITAEYSGCVAGVFPYLGAVGNGLIWLGAALLEMVVTSYLLYFGAGTTDRAELVREAAGLFALELLGLVAMWTARWLWTRAKLLQSKVKVLEGPMRKSTIISMPSRW